MFIRFIQKEDGRFYQQLINKAMPGIGIGVSHIFKRGGVVCFTPAEAPSDLLATVISITQIDLSCTNNSGSEDGFSWEYSINGIDYSEHGTTLSGDMTYSATGLTEATQYWFRVRAYKGSSYSDYCTPVIAVTINSALIVGWRFDEEYNNCFNNGLTDIPFLTLNYSSAQYYNGKTYIAYAGDDDDPYIITYTHATGLFSAAVKVGVNPLSNSDDHGGPCILIDSTGYIHCVWGSHNSTLLYSKSTNTEDITEWTSMDPPVEDPDDCTYPQLFQTSDNKLWLFYRSLGGASSYWGYKTSTNGGTSWSACVEVSRDMAYWYYRKGIGDTFHAVGVGNNQTSATRKNVYYIFYNGTNWVNITGDIQPSPIILAGNNCTAHNSGDYYCPSANINFNSENKPIVIFPKSTAELDITDFNIKALKYDGSWQLFDIVHSGGLKSSYTNIVDVISDTTFHVYLIRGEDDPYKGTLERWISTDTLETWNREQVIREGVVYPVVMVRNKHQDAKILFADFKDSYLYFKNSGYLWGESGFKGATNSITVPSINGSLVGTKLSSPTLVAGVYNNCYQFTGTNSIQVNDNDFLSFAGGSPDKPSSIAFRVNVTGTATQQHIMNKGDAAAREWQVYINSNTIRLLLLNAAGSIYRGVTAPFTTSGSWVHVIVTEDGSGLTDGMKIYLDNIESQDGILSSGTYAGMTNTTSFMHIGCYRFADYFLTGLIDEIRIFNKVLSPAERVKVFTNVVGW